MICRLLSLVRPVPCTALERLQVEQQLCLASIHVGARILLFSTASDSTVSSLPDKLEASTPGVQVVRMFSTVIWGFAGFLGYWLCSGLDLTSLERAAASSSHYCNLTNARGGAVQRSSLRQAQILSLPNNSKSQIGSE